MEFGRREVLCILCGCCKPILMAKDLVLVQFSHLLLLKTFVVLGCP